MQRRLKSKAEKLGLQNEANFINRWVSQIISFLPPVTIIWHEKRHAIASARIFSALRGAIHEQRPLAAVTSARRKVKIVSRDDKNNGV